MPEENRKTHSINTQEPQEKIQKEETHKNKKPKQGFWKTLFFYSFIAPISFVQNTFTSITNWLFGNQNNSSKSSLTTQQVKDFLSNDKAISGPEAHKLITQAIDNRKDKKNIAAALAVDALNMGDNITMYGRHIEKPAAYQHKDQNIGSNRKAYDVHPYRKPGAGADAVVMYQDEKTGDYFILMGRKKDRTTGKLVDELSIPGGYMQPFPLEGGRESDVADKEAQDKAEEALLAGKNTNMESVKLASSKGKISYDHSLDNTMLRELQEETGLTRDKIQTIIPIGTRDTYGMTNDQRLHTVVKDYFVGLGTHNKAPTIQDNSDLQDLQWVNVKDIQIHPEIKAQPFGSDKSRFSYKGMRIRDDHGIAMNEGIGKYRDAVFETYANGLSVARASYLMKKEAVAKGEIFLAPQFQLGKEAEDYYTRLGEFVEKVLEKEPNNMHLDIQTFQNMQMQALASIQNKHAEGQPEMQQTQEQQAGRQS